MTSWKHVHDEPVRVVAFTEEEATMSATWLSLGSTNGTLRNAALH